MKHRYTSMAFPAIGCGGLGCSVQIVVKTMVNEMKAHLKKRNLQWTVKFVITPDQTNVYDEFCKQVLTNHEGKVHNNFSAVVECASADNLHAHSYRLPSTWEKQTGNKKRLVVPVGSSEYTSVASHFNQSIQASCKEIVRIERIQNERWYMQYAAHSKDFRDRLSQDTEKRLFHGCAQVAASAIIEDGFNRSSTEVNGKWHIRLVHLISNCLTHRNSLRRWRLFLVQCRVQSWICSPEPCRRALHVYEPCSHRKNDRRQQHDESSTGRMRLDDRQRPHICHVSRRASVGGLLDHLQVELKWLSVEFERFLFFGRKILFVRQSKNPTFVLTLCKLINK